MFDINTLEKLDSGDGLFKESYVFSESMMSVKNVSLHDLIIADFVDELEVKVQLCHIKLGDSYRLLHACVHAYKGVPVSIGLGEVLSEATWSSYHMLFSKLSYRSFAIVLGDLSDIAASNGLTERARHFEVLKFHWFSFFYDDNLESEYYGMHDSPDPEEPIFEMEQEELGCDVSVVDVNPGVVDVIDVEKTVSSESLGTDSFSSSAGFTNVTDVVVPCLGYRELTLLLGKDFKTYTFDCSLGVILGKKLLKDNMDVRLPFENNKGFYFEDLFVLEVDVVAPDKVGRIIRFDGKGFSILTFSPYIEGFVERYRVFPEAFYSLREVCLFKRVVDDNSVYDVGG